MSTEPPIIIDQSPMSRPKSRPSAAETANCDIVVPCFPEPALFSLVRATRKKVQRIPEKNSALGFEDAPCRWRVVRELRSRPDRSRHEIAAAVRAAPAQLVVRAIAAEGALERADT